MLRKSLDFSVALVCGTPWNSLHNQVIKIWLFLAKILLALYFLFLFKGRFSGIKNTVFSKASGCLLEKNFQRKKPSKTCDNWVFFIGILGVILYLTSACQEAQKWGVILTLFLIQSENWVCSSLGRLWTWVICLGRRLRELSKCGRCE